MMTNQEIFDRVACHLLRQNVRSVTYGKGGDFCLYRGPNGTSCAVGCLIPDEDYSRYMERKGVRVLMDDYGCKLPFDQDSIPLLSALQKVHDDNMPSNWILALSYVAVEHNLNAAVLRWHFAFPAVQS